VIKIKLAVCILKIIFTATSKTMNSTKQIHTTSCITTTWVLGYWMNIVFHEDTTGKLLVFPYIIFQWQCVHVSHVSHVSLATALKKLKIKSLLFYFHVSVILHTLEHSKTYQIKWIISQLEPSTHSLWAQTTTSWLKILSAFSVLTSSWVQIF
jgi:hypothetical protein